MSWENKTKVYARKNYILQDDHTLTITCFLETYMHMTSSFGNAAPCALESDWQPAYRLLFFIRSVTYQFCSSQRFFNRRQQLHFSISLGFPVLSIMWVSLYPSFIVLLYIGLRALSFNSHHFSSVLETNVELNYSFH